MAILIGASAPEPIADHRHSRAALATRFARLACETAQPIGRPRSLVNPKSDRSLGGSLEEAAALLAIPSQILHAAAGLNRAPDDRSCGRRCDRPHRRSLVRGIGYPLQALSTHGVPALTGPASAGPFRLGCRAKKPRRLGRGAEYVGASQHERRSDITRTIVPVGCAFAT
jgi:hypothetical protein